MAYAEDCKSFYIGSIPVPASILFRLSSAVEQSAVNRSVICSNQIVGAKVTRLCKGGFLFAFKAKTLTMQKVRVFVNFLIKPSILPPSYEAVDKTDKAE